MSASESTRHTGDNSLYRVASGGAVILGVFLLLGGSGHFFGVQAALENAMAAPDESALALLLPALILIAMGLTNLGLCAALWRGRAWSLDVGLVCNTATAAYLAYLLARGIPGHPIGTFLALATCLVVLLGALRAGLRWPAMGTSAD